MVRGIALVLLLALGGLLPGASRCMVEAYFGYEVVEDRRPELEVLEPLLRTRARALGLGVLQTAPERRDGWWLAHAVIGWRGADERRQLVLTLEVEQMVDGGAWWSDRVTLARGYTRDGAVDAFAALMARAQAALPGL